MDDLDILVDQVMADAGPAPAATPAAGAPPDPTAGGGDSPDDLVAEAEAEALAAVGVQTPAKPAKAKPQADEPPADAATADDSDDPLSLVVKEQFGGDRAAAAAYFKSNPGRLQAMEQAIEALRTSPPDPKAVEKALEQEIQSDGQVVDCNREIERIESDITSTREARGRILRALGEAQNAAAEFRGQVKIAADDQKAAIRAEAAAKDSEVASLLQQLNSHDDTLKRCERDKAHYDRRLTERVREIEDEVSDRANTEARAAGQRAAIWSTFDQAVSSTATALKLTKPFTSFHKEAVRALTVLIMKQDPSPVNWPLARIEALTRKVAERYARENGMTPGARAVALSRRAAPSDPRPASERVAPLKPQPEVFAGADLSKMTNTEKADLFRRRARGIESRGLGVARQR